jgi:hypothetical protein
MKKQCTLTPALKEPTGSAQDGKKTFFGRYGFGFEEWLLDPTSEVEGGSMGSSSR